MILLIISILSGYIIGSFPTSIIVSKLWAGIDIREHGSGNAGFTNVGRVLGWKPAILVMIVDLFKGFSVSYWIAPYFAQSITFPIEGVQLLTGCSAIIGHIWTLFAGFRGGKGVLTAGGVFLAIIPLATIISVLMGLLIMLLFRYVSLGSMVGGICLPLIIALQKYTYDQPVHNLLFIFSILTALLILFSHRSNIKRLLSGTENKIGSVKSRV